MAKLSGIAALESADSLYTPLGGVVPFTNDGGPAHLLTKATVDDTGTFSTSSGTEADAWPGTGNPYFICDTSTANRYYEFTPTTFPISAYPFTVALAFKATNTNPGWAFVLYNSADSTKYIALRCGGSSFAKTIFEVKDGTNLTKSEINGTGFYTSGTWYTMLVTVADDGSGNAGTRVVYKNNTIISGMTDTGTATVFPTGLNRIRVGTALPRTGGGYFRGDVDVFFAFPSSLGTTERTKVHDDFAAGGTPTWGLLKAGAVTQNIVATALITESMTAAETDVMMVPRRTIPIRPPIVTDLTARPLVGRGTQRGL